jgi:tripartite-type tricarboxylate transporter receptor subunit TctC
MKRAQFLRGAGALVLAAPGIVRARAAYPDKQIRMVIPFAPGGTTDLLARAVAQHFSQAWSQPVVADNHAGANGVVAGEIVAKAPGATSWRATST